MRKVKRGDQVYVPSKRSLTTTFPHIVGGLVTVLEFNDTFQPEVRLDLPGGHKHRWWNWQMLAKRQKDCRNHYGDRKAYTTNEWPYNSDVNYWPRTKGVDY